MGDFGAHAAAKLDAAVSRAVAAEAERLKWAIALQSLTPGGSEFQTPEACVEMIRERRQRDHERLLDFAKRRNAAEARVAEAERLLRGLQAAVLGECPSLLDEDSGGDAGLAIDLDAFLSPAPESEAP